MVLTAKCLSPPWIHKDSRRLAYRGVCGQSVTHRLSLAWHTAAIVGALYVGTVEGGHSPTVLELTGYVAKDFAVLCYVGHYVLLEVRTQELLVRPAAKR